MKDSTTVELLAPAGGPRALRAALSAGADAVYFGLERWSARAFADNFGGAAAAEAVDTAHLYGARAYLTLNTLVKDEEIGPALAALEAPYLAGLDALIVTDLGFAARVRSEYPDVPLHASTQVGAHSSAQLAALAELGFRRAILARELSLEEIAALDAHGLELEAFVHGALCYGYSGECLLSSMVGGRSGNRGRCSQACRLRYSLTRLGVEQPHARSRDGTGPASSAAPTGASRVLSTSDLAALGVLPRLVAAGVRSCKIEGRMKDAEYVGVTTAVYREALDAALADPDGFVVRTEWRATLEQSFSRSFTTAHLEGRHHEVRSGGRGGHRGVLVGRVSRVDEAGGLVEVRLSRPVAAGDVVYLYTPWGQSEPVRLEQGGQDRLVLRLRERVAVKDRLFRLTAAESGRLARDLASGRVTLRPIPLFMRLAGEEGRPATLTVILRDSAPLESGDAPPALTPSVAVTSSTLLSPAHTAALTEGKARNALAALGGTPYDLAELEYAVADGLFLGVGDLKELRRSAVAQLDAQRLAGFRRAAAPIAAPAAARGAAAPAAAHDLSFMRRPGPRAARPPRVILVVRPGEPPLAAPDVEALCLDVRASDAAAELETSSRELTQGGLPIRLRLPEVLFDADAGWWQALLARPWAGVYARHLGVLAALRAPGAPAAVLEYPLQGLNGLVAGVARGLAGRVPAGVVVSPESSLREIAGLSAGMVRVLPPDDSIPSLEILAFGRQQVLHTRDQLGRAEGLYGPLRASEHVRLMLEDAKGYLFPAEVDARGTRISNARVTNLAGNLDELREAGISTFLVVQSDLDARERAAFAAGGLAALAPFVSRERSTTGHLFRGVA